MSVDGQALHMVQQNSQLGDNTPCTKCKTCQKVAPKGNLPIFQKQLKAIAQNFAPYYTHATVLSFVLIQATHADELMLL